MQQPRSQLIVAFLGLAALLAACNGGVTDECDDPNPMENLLAMSGPPQPLELVVEVPDEVGEGEPVPMTLVLRNAGNETVKVAVGASGHTGDRTEHNYNLWVFGSDADVVGQRLTGPVAQLPTEPQVLEPNGAIQYEWTWDQRDRDGESAGPGTYQVIGVLDARIVGTQDASGLIGRSEPVSLSIR